MKMRNLTLPLVLSGLLVSCQQNELPTGLVPAPPPPLTTDWLKPDLGLQIYRDLYRLKPESNICFSPFSLYSALGLAANAADGNTREQILSALGLTGVDLDILNQEYEKYTREVLVADPGTTVETANVAWYQDGMTIKGDFTDRIHYYYGAEAVPVDFLSPTALDIINGWVKEKTHGVIPSILNTIPNGMLAGLANATYFNGRWTDVFDRRYTSLRSFTKIDRTEVDCALMHGYKDCGIYSSDLCDGIELSYGNKTWAMYAFMPHSSMHLGELTDFLVETWPEPLAHFEPRKFFNVWFPQFQIESEINLVELLKLAGIQEMFTSQADFSAMTDTFLKVDNVTQKTLIKVNEDGTEAAAATIISFVGSPLYVLYFDRPFIYVIAEKMTGTILFIGQVTDPSKKK